MEDLREMIKKSCTPGIPASDSHILGIETMLNLSLPVKLKGLLKQTNGISDKYGADLIWSANKILEENINFRTNNNFKELYMPFENLLFFGSKINGDLFAFVILNNEITRSDVFIWEHETDSRVWFASGLKKYLQKRLNETIK